MGAVLAYDICNMEVISIFTKICSHSQLCSELQAHPGVADGGEEAHRAPPGNVPHGRLQEGSCQDREGGAQGDSTGEYKIIL